MAFRRWMRAEKSLPTENWWGLIYTTLGHLEIAYLRKRDEKTFWELERTAPQDEMIKLELEQVTHWHQLPGPPRGAK